MLTHNGQINTLKVSVDCHVVKKINPKPFKERSQENEMSQKTNTKISAPSLKSVWCIVSKLFAETQFYTALYGDAMVSCCSSNGLESTKHLDLSLR